MVSADGDPMIAPGQYSVSVGGGQPKTQASTISGEFTIAGSLKLPE
jgi:beta-glucosidase